MLAYKLFNSQLEFTKSLALAQENLDKMIITRNLDDAQWDAYSFGTPTRQGRDFYEESGKFSENLIRELKTLHTKALHLQELVLEAAPKSYGISKDTMSYYQSLLL